MKKPRGESVDDVELWVVVGRQTGRVVLEPSGVTTTAPELTSLQVRAALAEIVGKTARAVLVSAPDLFGPAEPGVFVAVQDRARRQSGASGSLWLNISDRAGLKRLCCWLDGRTVAAKTQGT